MLTTLFVLVVKLRLFCLSAATGGRDVLLCRSVPPERDREEQTPGESSGVIVRVVTKMSPNRAGHRQLVSEVVLNENFRRSTATLPISTTTELVVSSGRWSVLDACLRFVCSVCCHRMPNTQSNMQDSTSCIRPFSQATWCTLAVIETACCMSQ